MAIRTYGLSGSGMDVDQLVKDLMKAQRTRYDTLVQKKTQTEWKKADYNTMYTTINDFRNTVFNYKMSNTVSPKLTTSSDESVAKVTAIADAANISHSLVVTQLAEGVTLTSAGPDNTGTADDTITTGASKDTLANQFTGLSGTFKIKITNGTSSKEISIDTSQSIMQVVSDINSAGINVKANYDTTLDRFFLSTTNTGASTTLDFTGSDLAGLDFLEDNLKLDVNPANNKGQDAKLTLDGAMITQATNTFSISGLTYNLQGAGTTTIAVKPDNEKTIANVKAFVEAYNNTLSKINAELTEDRYKDYLPLTDDEKQAMSESQITAWEAKAKSGSLRRNSTLQDAVSKMRSAIYNPVAGLTGKYTSLSSLGITTGDYSENGKLYVNDTKLKEAIEADPDIINKMFTTTSDSTSGQGIAVRLYDTLKTTMDKIGTEAGYSAGISGDTESTLAKLIRDYDKQMTTLADRLDDMEESYYNKFNAMEIALSKLSQQSSWLTSQLG
ncbi:flagellar filament capping protein FliD [Sporomusa malonica]|uniref:Flagellar hook-associated protein 2 n=1 Tax=Sporomusa malonica TaxID=112901 RepID=A0A1W1YUP0_9FIRM|nr:flagellar filament capping protein FliD [Sporomusa malonica]SMC39864.1 flagellar hook-associated protein 2 [Sporomusa malonica]